MRGLYTMGLFHDEQDVYECIGRIFEDAIADAEIGPRAREGGLTMFFTLHDPESAIWVDFAKGEVLYGTDVPDAGAAIRMEMKADDANRFWLGKLNLAIAIAKNQVSAKGSVPEMLKMLPLAEPLSVRYAATLKANGRDDLIAAAG